MVMGGCGNGVCFNSGIGWRWDFLRREHKRIQQSRTHKSANLFSKAEKGVNLEVHCVACNKGFYGEVCLLWRRATTLLGRDAERGDDAAGAHVVPEEIRFVIYLSWKKGGPRSSFTTAWSTNVMEIFQACGLTSHGEGLEEIINLEMGFAFDDHDLEYYTKLVREAIKFNPTNVELLDIVQSNIKPKRLNYWLSITIKQTSEGGSIRDTYDMRKGRPLSMQLQLIVTLVCSITTKKSISNGLPPPPTLLWI
ncbi:hypothetical protein JHK84_035145 [Glycine max]|nr:hypothetical protein JHK84_035145 [Glycine max]